MKKALTLVFLATAMLAEAQTFTGVVTDSMCGKDHSKMNLGADGPCSQACVKAGAKYALYDGKKAYRLSDQTGPAKFAGQKVTVTGTLVQKTGIIQVVKIVGAK